MCTYVHVWICESESGFQPSLHGYIYNPTEMMKQFVVVSVTPWGMLTECMLLGATQFAWLVVHCETPVHNMFLKTITFCSLLLEVFMFG